MAQTPAEMEASMLRNLVEKTGKTLDQWLKITARSGLEKHGQIVKFLKSEHGMTHGYANLVAHKTLQAGASQATEPDLVDAQYGGAKAALRPIYDALIDRVAEFGGDLEVSPKKTYVSLRRSKQFALIQPSTRTRVDVGINLKGVEPSERLEASGSFNAMVSHRVRITDQSQVDAELIGWLRRAYELA